MRKILAIGFVLIGSWILGAEDMPKLCWMDDEKARRAATNVVMKILREEKSLSYAREDLEPCRNVEDVEQSDSGGKKGRAKALTSPDLFDSVDADVSSASANGGATSITSPQPTTDNILVHGDNLEALHALLPFYAGQVKCIYIDPPYNTGSAFEHYDDNLEHSTWLSLMYPRLKLLWDFLSEDGSIWISIDDDEGHYLKVLCDEIFGRRNFIANIVWQKRYSRENREAIGDVHDHILLYAKVPDRFKKVRNKIPVNAGQAKVYKNPNNDPRGRWRPVPMTAQAGHATPDQFYTILSPSGKAFKPPAGRCWSLSQKTFEELRSEGRIWFGKNGDSQPNTIRYLSEVDGFAPWTWWPSEETGHNDESKKEMLALFDKENIFDTPKPERLIQRILTIATNPGDLVLDSFLGSGTTAAVAQKMGRRWIGIEMGEHAKTHCAVRLKKVIDGEQGGISKAVDWKGGGGFRYYELGEAILQNDGTLSQDIPFDTMAAHVWFSETKRPYSNEKKSTILGVNNGVAYALLYNGILGDKSVSGGNVLTKKTLKVIRNDLDAMVRQNKLDDISKVVVYAEAWRLSEDTLRAEKLEFKQTPYDFVVRK